MPSDGALLQTSKPIRAIAVARDMTRFPALAEALEIELGAAWSELEPATAHPFLRGETARTIRFVVVAADAEDERQPGPIVDVTRHATSLGLKVILVSAGLSRAFEDRLAENGADATLAHPFKAGALRDTIRRVEAAPKAVAAGMREGEAGDASRRAADRAGGRPHGALYAVQSAAGGDGATTFAVNLAWELSAPSRTGAPSVCIIDLGLQFGSVATYLDLPCRPMIFEILSDVGAIDEQAFRQALVTYQNRLSVFTAPADILPLDIVGPEDVGGLLRLARSCFDIVIVDMPGTVAGWTDTVFGLCDQYFVLCGLEVRSAQNALRFQRLLKAEGIAIEALSFVVNRAPGQLDLGGRGRVSKLASSLGVAFHAILPDGGRPVTEANDQAGPLAALAPRNALTKEIRKVAAGLRATIEERQARSVEAPRAGGGRTFLGLRFG